MATLQEQLDEIEAKLTAGVRQASTSSGVQIEYDMAALQARADQLRRQLASQQGHSEYRRVTFRG